MKYLERTRRFERDYRKLSPDIQKRTNEKLQLLLQNPLHPSLRVKKVRKYKNIFECSITKKYRLLFEISNDGYLLHQIGTHDILDKG